MNETLSLKSTKISLLLMYSMYVLLFSNQPPATCRGGRKLQWKDREIGTTLAVCVYVCMYVQVCMYKYVCMCVGIPSENTDISILIRRHALHTIKFLTDDAFPLRNANSVAAVIKILSTL